MITRKCPVCGKEFSGYPSIMARRRCCSRTCANTHVKTGRPHTSPFLESQARVMSEVDAAWLAGLFDGEGSIILRNRRRPGGGSLVISIYNCCYALLERVVEVTGCGTIVARKVTNPRHSPSFFWQVGTVTAVDLLQQMRPWLISKAERADDAIAGRMFERQARWD